MLHNDVNYICESRGNYGGWCFPDFIGEDPNMKITALRGHLSMLYDPLYQQCLEGKLKLYPSNKMLDLDEGRRTGG